MASSFSDKEVRQDSAISSHQLAAVSAPGCRTSDLVGNFGDFADLFEQLDQPPVVEIGGSERKRLRPRPIGTCRASHNRALLDGAKN